MPTRLSDIAAQLGISVSTVSLALRGAPQVADATRLRVQDAATRLGYTHRPRQALRSSVAQVAFITPSEPGNIFYAAVLEGAEAECRRQHITLHYARLDADNVRAVQVGAADALLVVGSVDEALVRQMQRAGRPTVLVDNNLPFVGLDRVLIENVSSVQRVVHYLARLGHQQIAFLMGPPHPSFGERLLGYRAAIGELGLEPLELITDELEIEVVEDLIGHWLGRWGRLPFTALIACNDLTAIGALYGLQKHGIHVPGQVSVVGFDDVALASVVRPALTTCRVHRELLGVLAVRRLLERAADPQAPAVSLTLETVFVERASTGVLLSPFSGAMEASAL